MPKISSSRRSHRRRVHFAEQTTEQLVEVPTIISYSSLRGIVEQNVDIPVPRGRGRVGLGLHPGQSSTAFGGAEFLPAAIAEQNVDIPVPRGGRDLPSAASSSGLPGTANQWVFSTFPRRKSAEVLRQSSPRVPASASSSELSAHQMALARESDELADARRDRLFVVSGPQERVQRRTVQQIIDFALLPTLDDPAPQMVEQLPDVLQFFGTFLSDPEQVVKVPKISSSRRSHRRRVRFAEQLAEQLVEVPTIVSYSLLQLIMEQNADIPVPLGRGGRTLVFKVLPQNRVQQQRFLLQNAFLSGLWSRTLTFLSVEAFKIFAQVRVHPQLRTLQLLGLTLRMRRFNGFFALFPKTKKVRHNPPHSGSALPPHSSPWTPAAHDASMVLEEEEEESEDEPVEYVQHDGRWWECEWDPARQRYCWWLAAADASQVGHTVWRPPWLIGTGPG